MNDQKVVIGIFENEFYATVAKKYLRDSGIRANLLKEGGGVSLPLLSQVEGVQLLVPDAQADEAEKKLKIKFI
ncbi:MAG: hypothetical protein M1495_00785 [Bacteroidetes bacterium]|nr:hypothetical protein [Bacteroidota bacterium]